MKALFMLLVLIGSNAHAAETFIQLKLKVGMEVYVHGSRKFAKHKLKCKLFGGGETEVISSSPKTMVSSAGDGRVESEQESRSYVVEGVYADRHTIRPRALTILTKNATLPNRARSVEVQFSDLQSLTKSDSSTAKCHQTDWHARASKATINGSLRLGYKMPKDTWAVKVVREIPKGMFNVRWTTKSDPASRIKGDLMDTFDGKVGGAEHIVWATPGSEVYQEITFENFDVGGGANGGMRIHYIPIARSELSQKDSTLLVPIEARASEIVKLLNEDFQDLDANNYQDEPSNQRFLEHSISLIARPELIKRLVTDGRTDQMNQLAAKLGEIANGGRIGQTVAHVQAAATILAYEVSLNLLQDLGPYCEVKNVDLPLTGKKVAVSGLRLAFLYLSRAQARVRNYNFNQYQAYLDQLRVHETNQLSYSQVRNDAKKVKQMQIAYKVLQTALGDRMSPFKGALDELHFVLSQFKSVGMGEAAMVDILQTLTALGNTEDQFIKDFVLRLRQFRASNDGLVNVQDLQARLKTITTQQERVANLFKDNVRLLSLDDNADVDSFVGIMQGLISHNVNIFTKPLKFSVFENIRAVYLNKERVTNIVKQANKCINEGIDHE